MHRPVFQLRHGHLDVDRKLIYVSIPKNACTSLKTWFFGNLGIDTEQFDGGELHDYGRRHHNLATLDPAEAERRLDRAFVFAFVREPVQRIASGYLNKFVSDTERVNFCVKHVMEAVHRQRGCEVRCDTEHAMSWGGHVLKLDSSIDYEFGLTFQQFVDHLCSEPDDLALNEHWRPQWRFLEGLRIDFLGRVERLDADMARLCARLGLTPPRIESRNRTPYAASTGHAEAAPGCFADTPPRDLRRLPSPPRSEQLLTPDLRDRLRHRYAEDIRRCGQAASASLCCAELD